MNTIRRQLTRRLLLGMSLLLVIGAGVIYLTTGAALTRQFDDALRTKAMALTSIIEQDKDRILVDASDQIMREFDTNSRAAFFQIWRPDGSVVAISPSMRGESLPLRYNELERPEYWNLKLAPATAARAAGFKFQPHPANDSNETTAPLEAILVVAADRRNLDQALATLALVLAASSLLVLVLTAVIVPLLLRRGLAPLDRLAAEAQLITAESLAGRFSTDGLPDELASISARLNDLLQRLQISFTRERQFSDDLAHEFRTPIAELRSLAELSLKWPDTRNSDTDRNVLAIALQMEAIINRLLAITRGNMGLIPEEAQPVELAALISTVCKPLQARAAAGKLSMQTNIPATLEVQGDPVLLRSIVTNLLDNAVEYSKPGSAVQIQGETQNGHFTLRVINLVQQLHAEDVPHLFERFWRKDPARSGGEHSGLGLPLARAFATSLGYTLAANLDENEFLTLTLSGSKTLNRTDRPFSTAGQQQTSNQKNNES
ncbi:MAG TPA: ATP-binding protein [Verrucomicrobiae bacterium]|nr:ATP-binding protein [Verrucomicrobiae bacterium]